jgi:hypothetical protein
VQDLNGINIFIAFKLYAKKFLIGHACASHCVIFINKFAAVLAKIRLPSSS